MNNVLAITYWSYKDGLVQSATIPYLRFIRSALPKTSKVFLVTFEQKHLKVAKEEKKVIKKSLLEEGIHWIPFKYCPLSPRAYLSNAFNIIRLIIFTLFNRVSKIHTWGSLAGSFGYLISKLTPTKLILDSYEPHAESMVENKSWSKDSKVFKLLFKLEKLQSKQASHFIALSHGMQGYAEEKYNIKIPDDSFHVRRMGVDIEKFTIAGKPNEELKASLGINSEIIAVYAGKFGGIYLDEEIIAFSKIAHSYWNGNFKLLLLTATPTEHIRKLCSLYNYPFEDVIIRFVPHSDVAKHLNIAHFGLTPVLPVPTKRYCNPTKNGEYWAVGLPIVSTANISDDSDIIDQQKVGAIIENLDDNGYLKAIENIDVILHDPNHKSKIRNLAIKERWFKHIEPIYQKIYNQEI